MESLLQYGGITVEEAGELGVGLLEKLNIAFDNIAHEASVSKKELEDLRSSLAETTERHSLELAGLEAEVSKYRQKEDEYGKLLDSLDQKFRSAYNEKEELRTKLDDTISVNTELNYVIRNLENEKDVINEQLKHKLESLEELSAEIKSLKSESENVRKLKMDALFKLEDIASREASVKAQEGRWKDEIATLNDHNRWLEERLRETSDQLATIRRDTSQKGYALESELSTKTVELENSKKMIERFEETIRRLNQSNEDYIQKLKLVTDEQIKLEQLYTSEVDAQKQLVNLYKEQVKELEEKNETLSNGAASMQSLLKEAYENVSRLESEKVSIKSQFAQEVSKMQTTTQSLTVELEQSQQLLDKFRVDGLSEEELRHLNPAVAATLTALKRGHSLTQLYADYIQVVEDRDQLKLDKQRLTEYVEQLVSDLKEKAPVLRTQQEEYKKLQIQVKDLKAQLHMNLEKLDEAQIHEREYKRNAGFYQRETVRLRQTCADLSVQVKTLLREVETARGTVIHDIVEPASKGDSSKLDDYIYPDSSSTNANNLLDLLDKISSAGVVINDHLVTWRNLEELQSQNQKLLCIARDLANLLEQKEHDELETSKQVTDLSTRLETLSGELDLVRLSARQARSEANALARQKEQYRNLLEHYDIRIPTDDDVEANLSQMSDSNADESVPVVASPASNKGKPTPTPNVSTATVERLEDALSSLQAEFKRYREDKSESDNVYTTTIENLRKEGNEARLLGQKLAAQLDFTHEKLRTLEANVSGYKQEITVLREMNARYSTSAAASEAELSRLRDQLAQTTDRLTTAEVDARHFSRLLDASRAQESRWKQEIDSLRRQEQTHAQLMRHLEAIQGNLEQRESSDRTLMERRTEHLEKQLAAVQSTLAETTQAARLAQETLQNELAVARANTVSAEQEVERLSGLLQTTESQLSSMKRSYDDAVKSESPSQTSQLLQNSQTRIRDLEHEVDSLQTSLEAARGQAKQMRELAESAEKRLNEVVEENRELETRTSQNLTEIKQRCEFLEAQLDLEKKERQNLVNENIRTTEGAHQLNADLRKELATLQSEFDTMKVRYESALELESSAKSKIETHQRAAQEAREKYERELGLHAQDVEALTESRSQLENVRANLTNLEQALSLAQVSAEVAQTELKTQTQVWETTRQNLTEQLSRSVEEQNQMQEQIIKLTQQIVSLRKLLDKPRDTTSTSDAVDDQESRSTELRTSEDLLQVINYLRRQKNIADAAHDAASAEVSRLLLRVSTLETQKEQLETELERERRAGELAVETAQRHSEVMERVEQLNLLTESNRLLRHERETLRSSLSQLEEQLSKVQSDIGPLRQETNTLRAEVDSLGSEKRSLEEERDRWKERCNRLVETAQRMDPEQYRLACNERDELQRKLRRAEEEVQQNVNKLTELRTETDERLRKLTVTLAESQNSCQKSEQKVTEFRTQCDSLKSDLETKEMTVVKLRELARKYRQETEHLRRQLEAAGSDEAKLQTTSEALTEARADLVTLRADLSSLRAQYELSCSVITDGLQIIDEFKSRESFLSNIQPLPTCSESANPDVNGQRLVHDLRQIMSSLFAELDQLRQQSDMQKEKLLRMQLIESQLTKSLRDCAELRARLSDKQTAPATTTTTPATSGGGGGGGAGVSSTNQTNPILTQSVCSQTMPHSPFGTHMTDTETMDTVPHGHAIRPSTTPVQPVPSNPVVAVEPTSHATGPESSTDHSPAITSHQSVSPWLGRAAATVQPVQPTPTVVPSSVMTASKQTAEIRPITSNVATVMPTPAPPIVPITSNPSTSDSFATSGTTSSLASTSNLEVNVSSGFSSGSLAHSAEQQVTLLRGTLPRRTNLVTVTPPTAGIAASTMPPNPFGGLFNWSPNTCATVAATSPSTSLFGMASKRRHEESSPGSGDQTTGHAPAPTMDEETAPGPSSTGESAESVDLHGAHAFAGSEPKRLRQGMSTIAPTPSSSSSGQGSVSPVMIGRSMFGFSSPMAPILQATASRLVGGVQESFPSSSTTAVANIVTPITAVCGSPSTCLVSTTPTQPTMLLPSIEPQPIPNASSVAPVEHDVDMSASEVQDSSITESQKSADRIVTSPAVQVVPPESNLIQLADEQPTDSIRQDSSALGQDLDVGHPNPETHLIGSDLFRPEPVVHVEPEPICMGDSALKAVSIGPASLSDDLNVESRQTDLEETSNLEIDDQEPNPYDDDDGDDDEAEEEVDQEEPMQAREVGSTGEYYSEAEDDDDAEDEDEQAEEEEEVVEAEDEDLQQDNDDEAIEEEEEEQGSGADDDDDGDEVIELSSGSDGSQHSDMDNLDYASGNDDDDDHEREQQLQEGDEEEEEEAEEDEGEAADFDNDDAQNESVDIEQPELDEHYTTSQYSSDHGTDEGEQEEDDEEHEHHTDEEGSDLPQESGRMNVYNPQVSNTEPSHTTAPSTMASEVTSSSSTATFASESQKPGLFSSAIRPSGTGGLFSSFGQSFRSTVSSTTNAESGQSTTAPTNLFKSFLTSASTVAPSTSGLFRPSALSAVSSSATKAPETVTSTDTSTTTTSRPKIQPIVWDPTPQPSSTTHANPPKQLTGAIRRKKWGVGMDLPGSRPMSGRTMGSHGPGKPGMGRSPAPGTGMPPRRG